MAQRKGNGKGKGTALALVKDEQYAVLDPERAAEAMQVVTENLSDMGAGGLTWLDLPQVRVPGAGGIAFVRENEAGEEDTYKTVTGVIVFTRQVRTYHSKPFGEGAERTPPDCTSDDCVKGHGQPGGSCMDCPLAEWGSAGGDRRSQACRQRRIIGVLEPDAFLPTMVIAPPTSLRTAKEYIIQKLTARGTPFSGVTTEIGLKKVDATPPYSVLTFRASAVLSTQQRAAMAEYARSIKASLGSFDPATVADDAAQ